MIDAISFPITEILGKAEMVLSLFFSASFASFYKKKSSPGFIFFSFACMNCFLGILPSKLLMHSLLNEVTFSLVCLYLVVAAALQAGCIHDLLETMFRVFKGKSLKFYLALTALASFFPSKRVQKEMISFLKKKNVSADSSMNFLFPILFVLASSLTLMGCVTNLVADHICGEIMHGRHWGFFTYGPVSLSLFFVSFLFFFYVMRKQRRGWIAQVASGLSPIPGEHKEPHLMERSAVESKIETAHPLQGRALKNEEDAAKKRTRKSQTKIVTLLAFSLLLVLSLAGVPLVYTAPICAGILFLLGGFDRKGHASKLPWDIFLLVVAGFIFSHSMIETKLHLLIGQKLSFLQGEMALVTFFLFTSAVLSLMIPSIIAVSFLLPIAISLSASYDSSFIQLVGAAVTLGSFFLFPKKSIVSFEKRENYLDHHNALLKLQVLWISIVYFVFALHTYLLSVID